MPLDGVWYNELGSKMVLAVAGNKVSGTFETAVGINIGPCELNGLVELQPDSSQAVGFAVAWQNQSKNLHCITTWSGQFQLKGTEETIATTWLLTQDTDPNDDWSSTSVGQDLFTRNPPTTEKAALRKKQAPSHPA